MEKFLGNGQFGEVYEGILKGDVDGADNGGDDVETRVAIKTLKKSSSEHDKEEFLKEAQRMSKLRHEHVVRMIGVCFFHDELYIVMELMQGGDLLDFLRRSRPTKVSGNWQITMNDMITRSCMFSVYEMVL